jgi:hypothetical protein
MLIEYGCPLPLLSSSLLIMFPVDWKLPRGMPLFLKRNQHRCYTVNTGHFRRPNGWSSSISFKTHILKICFCLDSLLFSSQRADYVKFPVCVWCFCSSLCFLHPWSKYEQDPSHLADVLYEVPAACNHCGCFHEKKPGWLFLNACRSSSSTVGLRQLNAVDNYAVRKITYMITCKQKSHNVLFSCLN